MVSKSKSTSCTVSEPRKLTDGVVADATVGASPQACPSLNPVAGGTENATTIPAVNRAPIPPTAKLKRKRRKPMKARSDVWAQFSKAKEGDDVVSRCGLCGKVYFADTSKDGTSPLRFHMLSCNERVVSPKQQLLNLKPGQDGGGKLSNWSFNQEAIRKAVARMIIIDEEPFRVVDREGFRHVMAIACPRFQMPSRTTITRDCFKLFSDEKDLLRQSLQKIGGRISLTTDTWTSLQNINYMTLTGHYIDDDWILKKKILNFCTISSHKGRDIGERIEMCLREWGIEKVFVVAVDNASENDVVVEYLREKLVVRGTAISNGKYLHMRCAAHIINLIVSDGLKEHHPSVRRVREAVKYIRSSPSRLEKFKECIKLENIEGKSLLCLDVPTRWNSTYLMLNTAEKFERAFDSYEGMDGYYTLDLLQKDDGVIGGPPTSLDWENARKLVTFLEHFYDLTLKVSGSSYVTSCSFFHDLSVIQGMLHKWESGSDIDLRHMASKMKIKYNKYWGDFGKMNKLIYIAFVLDPREKLEYLVFTLGEMYGEAAGKEYGKRVKEEMYEMYEEYRKMNQVPSEVPVHIPGSLVVEFGTSSSGIGSTSESERQKLMRKSRFKQRNLESGVELSRNELDKYLMEQAEEEAADFSVLNWWRMNSARFPILACMARDALAIPISTVASEYAFSTGGRVLDEHRSSLTPLIAQALICGQNWVRLYPQNISVEENTVELEKLEEALSDVTISGATDRT